ncbi:unnamed protein product [Clonostachys rhizophaga]|uniref:Phospholipase/carboxylesterase/thioesterase domain-containing protein n=1 Tax=Clonostachys rhizophaga TaxID=160324 RepID=A0A9N9VHQ0_9HYPO|nr:unnamed protein product [Clonostachys rhizophaga]
MPARVPSAKDFESLAPTLPHSLHFPSPPESTTSILILLHGLGDTDASFASFARGMNLPGVLAISVRGTSPLPAGLLPGPGSAQGFHWGDDLLMDEGRGELDTDPGFARARDLVLGELVRGLLIGKLGWETSDVMFFGFGQGGSLALGLASQLRVQPKVVEVSDGDGSGSSSNLGGETCKGAVSIGGPLPYSMIPTVSSRKKSKSKVLAVQLSDSNIDTIKKEFEDVRVVQWKRREVDMPRNREEMFPIMKFFADQMRSWG